MFLLRKPPDAELNHFVATQTTKNLTYPEVGESRGSRAPAGYLPNHGRTQLGTGAAVFRSAVAAVQRWAMYDMDWVEVLWPTTPIEVGQTVGLRVQHFGFWSLNACRIIYLIDEADAQRHRWGFGYGTLPAHAERGEERFTVEWNHPDDRVWYELFSFARPAQPLSWIGFPLVRALQKRFARESLGAMKRSVAQDRTLSRSATG